MKRHLGAIWAGLLLATGTAAWGATISVNTAATSQADDGTCTLVEAIIAANSDAASGAAPGECAAGNGSDTIELEPSTYSLTTGGFDIDVGLNGLPVVTSEIVINGNGSTIERDSMASFRLFCLTLGAHLTLKDLTLQNGRSDDEAGGIAARDGGCILNLGGELVLINATVYGCQAGNGTANAGGNGGGISSTNGIVTLNGATINSCAAGDSSSNFGGSGGGFYATGGSVTVFGGSILGNHAGEGTGGGSGGGLAVISANLVLQNSYISTNYGGVGTIGMGGRGGGIHADASTVNIDKSAVHANYSGTGNLVGGSGGGLSLKDSSTTVTSSYILFNATPDGAAGTMLGGTPGAGGGIFVNGMTLTLVSSAVTNNATGAGGAGLADGGLGVVGGAGAALDADGVTDLQILGCIISENINGAGGSGGTNGYGGEGGVGPVYLGSTTWTMIDTTLSNNSAGNGGGAGSGGYAGYGGDGGGIFADSSTGMVRRSTISGNKAGNGGSSSTPRPGGSGGGIRSAGGSLDLANTTLSGNSAGDGGDALFAATVGAAGGTGGGIFGNSALTLANVTVATNSAGAGGQGSAQNGSVSDGGGIWVGGDSTIGNTIVAGNTPHDCEYFAGTITSQGSNIIQDNTCGFSGGVNPRLAGLAYNGGATETRALCSFLGVPNLGCFQHSPAIDAGSNAICASAAVHGQDQRGGVRPAGANCDIGAYELGSQPALRPQPLAARPGSVACIPAIVSASNLDDTLSHQLRFDGNYFGIADAVINPNIGPQSPIAKNVGLVSPEEGLALFTLYGGNAAIPAGLAYTALLNVSPITPVGEYGLGDGILFHVTTCAGDCDGDGSVSLANVQGCVNNLLGQPLCDFGSGRGCPMADGDGNGLVSIGELQQCINNFLTGCS